MTRPIRLLVIDDAPLADAIEKAWRAKSEAPLEIKQGAAADVKGTARLGADAVIYPSGMLGELAERRLLLPLTKDMQAESELNQAEIFDMLRLREVHWGEAVYAVPLGSPVLLLGYRADVLEEQGIQPPATWEEYHRAAAQLAQPQEADGSHGQTASLPAAEPWGPGWAGLTLLARAASYARHHDQYSDLFDFTTMKPLIDGPPFVRALEEMRAVAEYGSAQNLNLSPHGAFRELAEGRAALAIGWPPAAGAPRVDPPDQQKEAGESSGQTNPDEGADAPATSGAVRWLELPGSPDVYHVAAANWERRAADEPERIPLLSAAGRLGSVTRESSRSKAALHVLALLSGEWSREVAPHSRHTTLYRQRHVAAPADWYPEGADAEAAASYVAAAQQTFSRGVWMFVPRIPGRDRYLAALDAAVRQALNNEISPEDALRKSAAEWQRITAELGERQQIDAYQRSLGLEP